MPDRDPRISRHHMVRLEGEERARLASVYSVDNRFDPGAIVRLDLNDEWPLFQIIAIEDIGEPVLLLQRVQGLMPSR